MTKGTYTVDESSSGMDDACNERGSCNASAMECSDNSDSESEIFRVKRRSTSFDKPTSETKTSTLSERQVCYVLIMYILEFVLAEYFKVVYRFIGRSICSKHGGEVDVSYSHKCFRHVQFLDSIYSTLPHYVSFS